MTTWRTLESFILDTINKKRILQISVRHCTMGAGLLFPTPVAPCFRELPLRVPLALLAAYRAIGACPCVLVDAAGPSFRCRSLDQARGTLHSLQRHVVKHPFFWYFRQTQQLTWLVNFFFLGDEADCRDLGAALRLLVRTTRPPLAEPDLRPSADSLSQPGASCSVPCG